jgi:DNA-binding transcriptional LysR family regulator
MNALENELGVLLFDRSSRRPVLNAHGLQLLEAAQKLVQIADEAVDALSGRRAMGTLIAYPLFSMMIQKRARLFLRCWAASPVTAYDHQPVPRHD